MTTNQSARPLRVLQLTDPHLMARADGDLLGVNTRDSLQAVIDEVLRMHGQPDLVLATGDLAQDGSEEAYQVFGERLAVFDCESAWLSGNHDDAQNLAAVAARFSADRRQLVQGGWQFILLDSSVPGQVYGELEAAELDRLEEALRKHPDLPTMVSLHHHPVDIGCDWMQDIGLRNRDAFWQIVDRFPQVKAVLWGHIHQHYELTRGDVRLLATPSTCIQFTTGSREFSVEPASPGYRWFELQASGAFETGIHRALDFEFKLDRNSTGY